MKKIDKEIKVFAGHVGSPVQGAASASDQGAAVKRWPFVETPGEFAERLAAATMAFGGDMLAAVRNVLIENPPALAERAQAQPSGAVPKGWKLVPIEPTEEMDAAARAECHRMQGVIDPVIHVWDAMLAATPAPEQEAAQVVAKADALRKAAQSVVASFSDPHVSLAAVQRQVNMLADALAAQVAPPGAQEAVAIDDSNGIRSRAKFIAWLGLRKLDPTEDRDAWGGPIFKHSHIQAMWEGWVAFGQYGTAPVPATTPAEQPEGWQVAAWGSGFWVATDHGTWRWQSGQPENLGAANTNKGGE